MEWHLPKTKAWRLQFPRGFSSLPECVPSLGGTKRGVKAAVAKSLSHPMAIHVDKHGGGLAVFARLCLLQSSIRRHKEMHWTLSLKLGIARRVKRLWLSGVEFVFLSAILDNGSSPA